MHSSSRRGYPEVEEGRILIKGSVGSAVVGVGPLRAPCSLGRSSDTKGRDLKPTVLQVARKKPEEHKTSGSKTHSNVFESSTTGSKLLNRAGEPFKSFLWNSDQELQRSSKQMTQIREWTRKSATSMENSARGFKVDKENKQEMLEIKI